MMSRIKVAVIDSGINEELINKEKLIDRITIDENNNYKEDCQKLSSNCNSHGTICALIIEKYCPECVFSSIRILDPNGYGEVSKIEPALEWCYQNKVKIVNLSLGTIHFKGNDKLNRIINKYVYKGIIIVAAISNDGYFTYPASYTNVIGITARNSLLQYNNDYIHLGIDAIVPAQHIIKLYNESYKTSLSNSYAAPYITSFIIQNISEDKNYSIHNIKNLLRENNISTLKDNLYTPDWIFRAFMQYNINTSKASYYFEVFTGRLEEMKQEIDTIIVWSRKELEHLDIGKKNLVYLGNDSIDDIYCYGFKWSWQTRVQQIMKSHYKGVEKDIPLIILNIVGEIDSYFILSKFRYLFEINGYNPYIICTEPESILYKFEYMPEFQFPLTNQSVKNFIEGQIYYKQNDIILWNTTVERNINIYTLYPDYDVKILIRNNELLIYTEKKLVLKKYNQFKENYINDIYAFLINYLTV